MRALPKFSKAGSPAYNLQTGGPLHLSCSLTSFPVRAHARAAASLVSQSVPCIKASRLHAAKPNVHFDFRTTASQVGNNASCMNLLAACEHHASDRRCITSTRIRTACSYHWPDSGVISNFGTGFGKAANRLQSRAFPTCGRSECGMKTLCEYEWSSSTEPSCKSSIIVN